MENRNDIREFRVHDADREIKFQGTYIGQASSRSRNNDRWIEFALFRTAKSGKYIVSRIGKSKRFHTKWCRTVAKNPELRPVPLATLDMDDSPCPECLPDGDGHLEDNALVFPEKDRPWAGVLDDAHAVIDLLTQTNEQGASYMTHVARDLMKSAAQNDKAIHDAYYTVEIV